MDSFLKKIEKMENVLKTFEKIEISCKKSAIFLSLRRALLGSIEDNIIPPEYIRGIPEAPKINQKNNVWLTVFS